MAYKWKPSKAQKAAFKEKMSDPAEEAAYNQRKADKAEKRRSTSKYDYATAGGEYVPTEHQYTVSLTILGDRNSTEEQRNAANMVMSGYSCKEKVHHDNIHIVNEYYRSQN